MSELIFTLLGLAVGPVEQSAGSSELWMNVGQQAGLEVRMPPQCSKEVYSSQSFGRMSGLGIRGDLYCGFGIHAVVTAEAGPGGLSAVPGVQWWPVQGVELSLGIDVIRGRLVGGTSYWVSDIPGRSGRDR